VFVVLELARTDAAHPDAVELGLRFIEWLGGSLTGNLGASSTRGSVDGAIADALTVSAPLVVFGGAIGGLLGCICGVPAGFHAGVGDRVVTSVARLIEIVPAFWLASLLSLASGSGLHWFAPGGFVPWGQSVAGALLSLVLPALALGIAIAAPLTVILRDAVAGARQRSHGLAGAARYLGEADRFRRHGRRLALIEVAERLAPLLAALFAGSIVVEIVFYLPGLGRLLIAAAIAHDVPLLRGGLLVLIAGFVVLRLALQLATGWIDPRVRRRIAA
jgi:peptide/nickel transport system permease protein